MLLISCDCDCMQRYNNKRTGGIEVLKYEEKLPVPEVKDHEVLVKIAAIGVNFIDTYHRSGLYPLKLPAIIGREASGVIEAVGAVSGMINEYRYGCKREF